MLKYTMKDLKNWVKNFNGKVISKLPDDKKIRTLDIFKVQCQKKHTWKTSVSNVKNKHWCQICRSHKYSIFDLNNFAKYKKGICISKKYFSSKTKYLWSCKYGHKWNATWSDIKNNKTWCPYCSKKAKYTIEQVNKYIKNKGKCLEKKYINTYTKMKFICKKGHNFKMAFGNIKNQKQWCPKCGKENAILKLRYKYEHILSLINKKHGKLIGPKKSKYIDLKTVLKIKCKFGHIWKTKGKQIKKGRWCSVCRVLKMKELWHTIDYLNKIAKKRGGLCISKKYKGCLKEYIFVCKLGHKFKKSYRSIVYNNSWCPKCFDSYEESTCRKIFEKILKKKFPKCHPKWLKNPKNNSQLELDGYCEELGIAFEYNGIRHYIDIQKENRSLINRKRSDKAKKRLCKINGVKLIVISHRIKNFKSYIEKRLALT